MANWERLPAPVFWMENPMGYTVTAKSQTRLSSFHFHVQWPIVLMWWLWCRGSQGVPDHKHRTNPTRHSTAVSHRVLSVLPLLIPSGFLNFSSGQLPLPQLKPASLLGWIAAAAVYGLSSVPLQTVAHSTARLLFLKCSTFTPLVKAFQCLSFIYILNSWRHTRSFIT